MADVKGFVTTISVDSSLSETDLAILVAWFLAESSPEQNVTLANVCDFIEQHRIRTNINRSRLQAKLVECRDISAPKGRSISLRLDKSLNLRKQYGQFLAKLPPLVEDTVLSSSDFATARPYIRSLVTQINGCRQFAMYDACAVMMRRLAEVLIIDAFESVRAREEILEGGNYKMLSGLIGALTSGKTFKLSRNAPRWIERLKELGDNAAHSRTYITKEIDIDEFKGSYRNLISELQELAPLTHPSSTPK